MHDLVPLEYGQYYHVYNRGNSGENIFVEERNYPYFLDLHVKYIEPIADTFAYALLRNHFHLLVRIKDLAGCGWVHPGNLPGLHPTQQFSNFFNSYVSPSTKPTGAPAVCSRNALAVSLLRPTAT